MENSSKKISSSDGIDSDSGHGEKTSSSSSSAVSLEELDLHQDDETFVDATDEFDNHHQHIRATYESSNKVTTTTTTTSASIETIVKNKISKNGDHQVGAGSQTTEHEEEEAAATTTGMATSDGADLSVRLEETSLVLRMALNNQFVKALDICSQSAHKELYASLANATLCFLRAALTLEQSDLQAAVNAINQSFEVSGRLRRKSSAASMMMRLLYRNTNYNYNSFTDDQIHAELVNAESLLLLALISFLSDQSIICLVKGAFRIRTCYQRYKECQFIMDNRTNWQSETARKHFESGVRMGNGIFNLLMSYLPRRVLRFLEYVGFSGNRSIGVEELEKSVHLNDQLRSVFSSLVILVYHSYIENLFGLGIYDASKVKQLNESLLVHYPNSAFFLLFRGRYHQMEGNLQVAIDNFEQCIKAQDDWKQFHSICHWEMMWCYAVQLDWKKAAYYSDLLRKNSKWSAASYTYQYATFLYAQLVDEQRARQQQQQKSASTVLDFAQKSQDDDTSPPSVGINDDDDEKWRQEYERRMAEIVDIMKTVPELRIRYAGKTIPAEKFAITRSMKFCQQQNRLTLPALEFLYIWNIFVTLAKSPQQVEQLLVKIDSEINYIEQQQKVKQSSTTTRTVEDSNHDDDDKDKSDDEEKDEDEAEENLIDDLCLALLLKGMCLKHLDRLDEAEACFMKVIDNEHNIKVDTFLVPHSAMELTLLNIIFQKYDCAKSWLKMARNNHTGYLLETMVHFRLHAASRVIRIEQQLQNPNLSLENSTDSATNGTELEVGKTKNGRTKKLSQHELITSFQAPSAS